MPLTPSLSLTTARRARGLTARPGDETIVELVRDKIKLEEQAASKEVMELQRDGRCFSFIEVLSTCPTNWGMSPNEATDWVGDRMMPYYPLGEFKTPE